MLLKCAALVAKKLLVDDKITAYLKQIILCLLGVMCKVSNRNTLSGETIALLKNVCYQCKFCASNNLLFYYKLLIGPQPTLLECIVIFL